MSRILVVDDDPSVLSAFEQMLSEQGHLVRVTTRGEEALEQLAKERPDLVIMDVRMGGMSGLETLRKIRAAAWRAFACCSSSLALAQPPPRGCLSSWPRRPSPLPWSARRS